MGLLFSKNIRDSGVFPKLVKNPLDDDVDDVDEDDRWIRCEELERSFADGEQFKVNMDSTEDFNLY